MQIGGRRRRTGRGLNLLDRMEVGRVGAGDLGEERFEDLIDGGENCQAKAEQCHAVLFGAGIVPGHVRCFSGEW